MISMNEIYLLVPYRMAFLLSGHPTRSKGGFCGLVKDVLVLQKWLALPLPGQTSASRSAFELWVFPPSTDGSFSIHLQTPFLLAWSCFGLLCVLRLLAVPLSAR
jgi:hypothetical protein